MQRLIAGLILAVVCASLHAQTMDLRATIPFAFRAGETLLPAGDYTIRHRDNSLVVHKEGGGPSIMLLTNAALRPNPPSDSRLNFNRYGERYFLSSIWSQGNTAGCEVMKSRAEKELGRQTLRESVGIALRRH